MLRIIRTRYKGPTDSHGSRIIATDLKTGRRLTHPYDHAASDAHFAAADALQAKLRADGANQATQWYGCVTDAATKDQFHAYDDSAEPLENGTATTNGEGLTWPEWARAAGASPHGEGILRDEWRAGVDPTEYRADTKLRDLLAGVVARRETKADAETWLVNHTYPLTGWQVVLLGGLWCVVKPSVDGGKR